jgi:uncharacterized tellurite resistance protein B-like protein
MLTIFESKKTKVQKSHVRNLVALAKADGQISSSELEFIHKIGVKQGLKAAEINSIIEESKSEVLELPLNDSDRFDQIFELVQMMTIDGEIDDNEMDFCILMAEKLGFRKAIVGVLVRKISLGLTTGLNKEAIKSESEAFLQF